MTSDREKLQRITEYKGGRVIVTANNSRLLIARVGKITIVPRYSPNKVLLQDIYHISSMKKNLLPIAQLTSSSHYIFLDHVILKYIKT